jgi:hypothetical protein
MKSLYNTIIKCATHTPNESAISFYQDTEYTFCEVCETNIEQFWIFDDEDRIPFATGWQVSN